jgi:hypothetical protein
MVVGRRENLFQTQAGELGALKKYKKELEDQLKSVTGEYAKAQTRVFALEDVSQKMRLELEQSKLQAEQSGKEAEKQRSRADAQSAALAQATAKARSMQEDLDLER